MRGVVVLFLLLVTGTASAADVAQCKASPKLAGPCFAVHGRLSIYMGYWNYRIWPIGSRRLLGVVDPNGHFDDTHPPLPRSIAGIQVGTRVFADFGVCPLTKRKPGVMQFVCVADAAHVVVEQIR